MRKLAVVCGLWVLFVAAASAPLMAQDQQQPQEQGQAPSDQNQTPPTETQPVKAKRVYAVSKYELSGGYAFRSYYPNFEPQTLHMNGWYGSIDYNKFRWLGFVGEAAGTYKFQSGINNINGGLYGDTSIYTFLGGPQVYPFKHHKLTPFGQFLYGIGYYRNVEGPYGAYGPGNHQQAVRAWEAGGGLDLALKTGRWAARLIQVDTTSANFFPSTQTYTNRSLIRISFGVVYHFGKR